MTWARELPVLLRQMWQLAAAHFADHVDYGGGVVRFLRDAGLKKQFLARSFFSRPSFRADLFAFSVRDR